MLGRNLFFFYFNIQVDLSSVTDGLGYSYYKNHLPKLGQRPETLIIPPVNNSAFTTAGSAGMFEVGERVRVLLCASTLKDMQEGHGGWNDQMEEVRSLVSQIQ